MLNLEDINAIGNILDFTVGHSGDGRTGVASSLQGNVLTLKFSTIVHFASERSMRDQVNHLNDESIQVLSDTVSSLKKEFKDATGNSLKVTELSNKSDLELIQATNNSPRKIAYYRRFADLQVDV